MKPYAVESMATGKTLTMPNTSKFELKEVTG
jgi:hypothetical protein